MIQTGAMEWRDALFLHWPVETSALQPLVPPSVTLQTYDGAAWISIVAFVLAAARPPRVPAVLGFPAFGEINVRTYVGADGRDGVWFFSLDAGSRLAVEAARAATNLPYFRARVRWQRANDHVQWESERHDRRAPDARFAADARFGGDVRISAPGTLDAFLVERYSLFAVNRRGQTTRIDVRHQPWLLRNASVTIAANTLLSAAGIPVGTEPLVHVSPGVSVRSFGPTVLRHGELVEPPSLSR
ncbi:MAG TPA: DUF2071 domain-containing protein [Candidatus Elarobacter sp.]